MKRPGDSISAARHPDQAKMAQGRADPSHPAQCLAAIFHGPEQSLELRSLDIPRLGPGEVLVRIECCTICGSDLHTLAGLRSEKTPTILGHEAIGSVVSLGPEPTLSQDGRAMCVGERVAWSVVVACKHCPKCVAGLPQKCDSLFKYGHELANGRAPLSGGLAEFIVLQRGSSVFPLAKDLPAALACPTSCAGATAAACCRTAGKLQGQRVLVLGAGMLGLVTTARASRNGAASVTVVDTNPQRLQRAEQFGATRCFQWPSADAIQAGMTELEGGFDVAFEMSGASACVTAAINALDVGGRAVLAGTVLPTDPIALDPQSIVRRCATLAGVHNYTAADLEDALAFVHDNAHAFPFEELVERTFPLSQINEAILFAQRHRPLRIAIQPDTVKE